jgi:hypothetical protein
VISLRYRTLGDAVEAFGDGVREFERALYRVTDRRRLTTGSDFELEWGNLVLLLAWDGTLDLILRACGEGGQPPPGAERQVELARVRASWATYVADFRDDVVRGLDKQFDRSVMARLRVFSSAPAAFTILEDVSLFFDDRDTIEVFLEAAGRQFPDRPFRRQVDGLDRGIRTHVLEHVWPALLSEYGAKELNHLTVEWLPSNYWWRHID